MLGWYILVETGSVLLLTLFAALQYGGTLIAPVLGVASDRVGHRNLMVGMRTVYATVAATLMLLALAGALTPFLRMHPRRLDGPRPSLGPRLAWRADRRINAVRPADRRHGHIARHLRFRSRRRRARRCRPVRGVRHRAGLYGGHGLLRPRGAPDARSGGIAPGNFIGSGRGGPCQGIVDLARCAGGYSLMSGTRRGCSRSYGSLSFSI